MDALRSEEDGLIDEASPFQVGICRGQWPYISREQTEENRALSTELRRHIQPAAGFEPATRRFSEVSLSYTTGYRYYTSTKTNLQYFEWKISG